MKRLTIVKHSHRRWLFNAGIAAGLVALTAALISLVLAPVGVLQHNEETLKAIKSDTESLVKTQDQSEFKLVEFQEKSNPLINAVCAGNLSDADQASLDKHARIAMEIQARNWKLAVSELTTVIDAVSPKARKSKLSESEVSTLSYDFAQRGYCFSQIKDYNRAISDFSNSIRLEPTDDYAYYNRAQAYHLTGRDELAEADLAEWRTWKGRKQKRLDVLNSASSP